MTDAPKIDTQAPRIGVTAGIDFSTGKDTTMLTLMIDGKLDHASTDGPWGQAILALLAERDLADARAAAAAQAMREAAAGVCQAEQERREWQHKDQHAEDGGWQKERFRVGAQQSRQLADKIAALPLPDPTALDRLIAERVREAVEAEREACAKAASEAHFWAQHEIFCCPDDWQKGHRVGCVNAAAAIRARGSKEGQS